MDGRRLGDVVRVLRWLSDDLRRNGYPLAHVPQQLAARLLDDPAEGSCRACGDPVPRNRTGRPRVYCLACSPQRKSDGKPDPVVKDAA